MMRALRTQTVSGDAPQVHAGSYGLTVKTRRAGSGEIVMGNAIQVPTSGTDSQTTGGTRLFSEGELRSEFTPLVIPFSPRQLARVSGATPEGARHWLDGSRAPNVANTLNIARALPSVNQWLAEKCDWRAAQARSADAVIAWASANRLMVGQEGAIARAVLREAGASPDKIIRASAQAAHEPTRPVRSPGSADGASGRGPA